MRVIRPRVLVLGTLMLGLIVWIGHFLLPARSAVGSGCPDTGAASSDLLLCEDFEDGGFQARWDIGGHQGIWPVSQFVRCDGDSFGFNDRCAGWSNHLVFDREWGFYGYDARRAFPPQPAFYVRWYQYISQPYAWGTLEDKSILLHDRSNTITTYIGTNRNHRPVEPNSGPGMPFIANYQDVDAPETGNSYSKVNRFQNQGRNITLEPGKWYLFEWYVALNTPGVSDGVTKVWIDDASQPITAQTLRMHYTDMRWRRSGDTEEGFGVLRLSVYNQRCDGVPNTCPPHGPSVLAQSHRWDRIVVSKAPVGPIASSRREGR
jgi:hypothetical protein